MICEGKNSYIVTPTATLNMVTYNNQMRLQCFVACAILMIFSVSDVPMQTLMLASVLLVPRGLSLPGLCGRSAAFRAWHVERRHGETR